MGCPLGNSCRFARLCAELRDPNWRKVPVGHLNETHLGRRVVLALAGRPLPIEGALTGLWPFSDESSVLRLDCTGGPARLHIVHDSVEVEIW